MDRKHGGNRGMTKDNVITQDKELEERYERYKGILQMDRISYM